MHTQGPWSVEPQYDTQFPISGPDSNGLRFLVGKTTNVTPTDAANARLIAAAPDMLEALQAVTPLMIPGMNWTDETGQLIKRMVLTAITKATGAQP